jgi:hypothetical protein
MRNLAGILRVLIALPPYTDRRSDCSAVDAPRPRDGLFCRQDSVLDRLGLCGMTVADVSALSGRSSS